LAGRAVSSADRFRIGGRRARSDAPCLRFLGEPRLTPDQFRNGRLCEARERGDRGVRR
jgi:hypothetical protein